ncbi:MAG: hypothetical protein DMF84_11595 [Acidobacteria bacterium]|nr:MAG: hypothetical protein DMF84_11595 [Acidobacteriota bacterium]
MNGPDPIGIWTRTHVNGWTGTVFQWEPDKFSAEAASTGTSSALRTQIRTLALAQAYADAEVSPKWRLYEMRVLARD